MNKRLQKVAELKLLYLKIKKRESQKNLDRDKQNSLDHLKISIRDQLASLINWKTRTVQRKINTNIDGDC